MSKFSHTPTFTHVVDERLRQVLEEGRPTSFNEDLNFAIEETFEAWNMDGGDDVVGPERAQAIEDIEALETDLLGGNSDEPAIAGKIWDQLIIYWSN